VREENMQEKLGRLLAPGQVDAPAALDLLIRQALAIGASDLTLKPPSDIYCRPGLSFHLDQFSGSRSPD